MQSVVWVLVSAERCQTPNTRHQTLNTPEKQVRDALEEFLGFLDDPHETDASGGGIAQGDPETPRGSEQSASHSLRQKDRG